MNITYVIDRPNPTKYDPLNLPRTVPGDRFSYDPVHLDAEDIIEKLKHCTRESEERKAIWEAFQDQFMDENAEDCEFDVWRYYWRVILREHIWVIAYENT